MVPSVTRLRYVSARKPAELVQYLTLLGFRVQIYGNPVWDGKRWYLWFVPPDDDRKDVKNIDL